MRGLFGEKMDEYSEYEIIYTDGSKQEQGVGAAAVIKGVKRKVSLPRIANILTAELKAIKLGLDIIGSTPHTKYVIATNSLSSITRIESKREENNLGQRILHRIHSLTEEGNSIVLTWLPNHVGISGNEEVDNMAKEAA